MSQKVPTILLDRSLVLGLQKSELSPVDALVVSVIKNGLLKSGKHSGTCVLSQEQIAWKLGTSRQTVNSSLNKLCKSGWVVKTVVNTVPRRVRYSMGTSYDDLLALSASDNPYEGMANPFPVEPDIKDPAEKILENVLSLERPAHIDLFEAATKWKISPFKFSQEDYLSSQGPVLKALNKLNEYLHNFGSVDVLEKISRIQELIKLVPEASRKFIPGALTFYTGENKDKKTSKSLYSDIQDWESSFSVAHIPGEQEAANTYEVAWEEATTRGLSLDKLSERLFPLINIHGPAKLTYEVISRLSVALYQNQDSVEGFSKIPLVWSEDPEQMKIEISKKLTKGRSK